MHVSWGGWDADTWNTVMGVRKFEPARDAVLAFIEIKQRTSSPIAFTLALRCPRPAQENSLYQRLYDCERSGLIEIADLEDYDSWAGKISPGGARVRERAASRSRMIPIQAWRLVSCST